MSLTAHQGANAARSMRAAGVRGVDAFQRACAAPGAPRQVRLPADAMDALVTANIDYYAADGFVAAVWRALGLPSRTLAAKRAVRCELLRQLYTRFDARRSRRLRPCAVEPVVRAALMALVRDCCVASTPPRADAIATKLDSELRRFGSGLLVLRGPLVAIRAGVYATAATLAVAVAATAFVTLNRAANSVPLAHHTAFALVWVAGATALASATRVAVVIARERDRAQADTGGGHWGPTTLTLAAAALCLVLA